MESRKMVLMNPVCRAAVEMQWRCRQNRLVDTEGKERAGWMERVAWKHMHRMQNSRWEYAVWQFRQVLCDNLDGWDGMGGRFKRQRTYVYLWLIHVDEWQKPTQYGKAVTLQLKINTSKKKKKLHLYWAFCFSGVYNLKIDIVWPEITCKSTWMIA